MSDHKCLLSAYQVTRELETLLTAAGVKFNLVRSHYDDGLDCEILYVVGPGLTASLRVQYHALAYSLNQFSDEVLAPFVAGLVKP